MKQQGKAHPIRESDLIKEGREAEFNRILNRPQNFFKHADNDPDEVLEFPAAALQYVLLQGTVLYEMYTGRTLREGWILVIWFGIHHPDVIRKGPLKAALEAVKQQAPDAATAKSTYLEMINRSDLFPLPNTD